MTGAPGAMMEGMHSETRIGGVDRIYLHTNEGPQTLGAAQNLVNYLATIEAGYHVVVDLNTTIVAAADDQVLWAQGGDNHSCLSVCMIGHAAQDWTTPYAKAEMERAAQQVATWCQTYDVPVRHVAPGAPGQAPTERGIAKHADNHSPSSGGHTDPGDGFPIDAFVARVTEILAAPGKLAAFFQMVASFVKPIRVGDHGKRVLFVQQLLLRKGYTGQPLSSVYGLKMVDAIHDYKVKNGWKDPDGKVAGLPLVKHLLK